MQAKWITLDLESHRKISMLRTYVLQIYAVDTTSVTSIVYTLQPQDGFGIFAIKSETGIVYVKTRDPLSLDFEQTKHYYLQVWDQSQL